MWMTHEVVGYDNDMLCFPSPMLFFLGSCNFVSWRIDFGWREGWVLIFGWVLSKSRCLCLIQLFICSFSEPLNLFLGLWVQGRDQTWVSPNLRAQTIIETHPFRFTNQPIVQSTNQPDLSQWEATALISWMKLLYKDTLCNNICCISREKHRVLTVLYTDVIYWTCSCS